MIKFLAFIYGSLSGPELNRAIHYPPYMHANHGVPFLWNYVKNEQNSPASTGGEERPFTASANEEAAHAIIELE
ncbi:MAG: hypothetical protein J4F36_09720 [Nitrosopumilaceae archaeon]|nr:hypothetical protein [Nitrosopumilaceae archaeon]